MLWSDCTFVKIINSLAHSNTFSYIINFNRNDFSLSMTSFHHHLCWMLIIINECIVLKIDSEGKSVSISTLWGWNASSFTLFNHLKNHWVVCINMFFVNKLWQKDKIFTAAAAAFIHSFILIVFIFNCILSLAGNLQTSTHQNE